MSILTALASVFAFSIAFFAFVSWFLSDARVHPLADCEPPRRRRVDRIQQINDLLAERSHHHEHIEAHMHDLLALRDTWVDLHGYELDSNEACELTHFWLNGEENYEDVIQRLMNWKKVKDVGR